jgi:hypothetical protein
MSNRQRFPTRLIVIRPAPGLPAGYLPESWDGAVLERKDWQGVLIFDDPPRRGYGVPTDRVEDVQGQTAQVYEIRGDHKARPR